jgi:hypothetical protein
MVTTWPVGRGDPASLRYGPDWTFLASCATATKMNGRAREHVRAFITLLADQTHRKIRKIAIPSMLSAYIQSTSSNQPHSLQRHKSFPAMKASLV